MADGDGHLPQKTFWNRLFGGATEEVPPPSADPPDPDPVQDLPLPEADAVSKPPDDPPPVPQEPPPEPSVPRAPLTERLRAVRDILLSNLVERDDAVRLALIAAVAGEHLLLLGDPGTAKSLVARRLHLALGTGGWFEHLLTRFTVPEELFGPLSVRALEDDRYERKIAGYLPTATIAFLDEIFKANSAILNALLTLLNEREFDNGSTRTRTPLVCVVGASNELPEGPELRALYDRFLLRLYVEPVSTSGFGALLDLRGDDIPLVSPELRLTTTDLDAVRREARHVVVPPDVKDLLVRLRAFCADKQIPVSDRRWRRIVHLLQVSAFTQGRTEVSVWDAWLLQHCTWDTPEQRKEVSQWYADRVGASQVMDPERLTRYVAAWEEKLERDKTSRSQARDEFGRLMYQKPDGAFTTSAKEPMQKVDSSRKPLYLAPSDGVSYKNYGADQPVVDRANGGQGYTRDALNSSLYFRTSSNNMLWFRDWSGDDAYCADPNNFLTEPVDLPPAMEPTRYADARIAEILSQLDASLADVDAYAARLQAHIETLDATIQAHLWITGDFLEPTRAKLQDTAGVVAQLRIRIIHLKDGFNARPREVPFSPPGA